MSEGKTSAVGPAIGGGVIGALLTAALLLFAAPQFVGSRIVRQGLMADPQMLVDAADALRDRQYEPTLAAQRAALETPFASSWKGAAKPDVVLVEFFDYACPYCKASNPFVDQLLKEDKGLRVVYRELPILGPESVAAARLSLAASKAGHFRQFHDALWAAGNLGGRYPSSGAADTHRLQPGRRGRAQPQLQARRPIGRDRHAAVRGRQQGHERRGRLRRAQESRRRRPRTQLGFRQLRYLRQRGPGHSARPTTSFTPSQAGSQSARS